MTDAAIVGRRRDDADGGALCRQLTFKVETSLSRFDQNGIQVKGVPSTPFFRGRRNAGLWLTRVYEYRSDSK